MSKAGKRGCRVGGGGGGVAGAGGGNTGNLWVILEIWVMLAICG